VTIIANLAERTSRPNCQACSGRRAGNWRGHSRESVYSDKRRDCERYRKAGESPSEPVYRSEVVASLGTDPLQLGK
jgi:hypothetical protein